MNNAAPTTRHKGTGRNLWSDGIHFVRRASSSDRHPMRFVVASHTTNGSKFKRHAPTEAVAISNAKLATAHWLKSNPADAAHLNSETPTPTAATPNVELQPFASTRFNCVYANPVAQVWKCVTHAGELRPIGRPKRVAGGFASPPEQTPLAHLVNDCAVLRIDDPIRTPDGLVRIFNDGDAMELAGNLYEDAPEENRIGWRYGQSRVGATLNIDILFDPVYQGARSPFILWFPEYRRPVYRDTTHSVPTPDQVPLSRLTGQLRIDAEVARKKAQAMDRLPSFESIPLRFRSIWSALKEADRREAMLRGENVA